MGNEIAAFVRLRAGRRLDGPALVVGSAILVALGLQIGDPLVGLAITLVIASPGNRAHG